MIDRVYSTLYRWLRPVAVRLPSSLRSTGREIWWRIAGERRRHALSSQPIPLDRGTPIAVVNLSHVKDVEASRSKQGLYFAGVGADRPDAQVDALIAFVASLASAGRGIAVVGDHPLVGDAAERLGLRIPASRILKLEGHSEIFDLRSRGDMEGVLLLCTEAELPKYLRTLQHALRFGGTVVVPSNREVVWPAPRIENPRPIMLCAYPCAGTNRFTPCFLHLLEQVKWQNFWFSPFMRNVHVILNSRKNGTFAVPSIEECDEAIYWRARTLDHLTCMTVHEWVSLRKFKDLDCSIVVLMRDPRDVINSYFWHTRPETQLSDEDHLLQIINGYTRFFFGEPAYAFHWPDAKLLVDSYLVAQQAPNMHIIRFEDLHANDVLALKDLMNRLELDGNPLFPLSDDDYSKAAYLGSFEYQTGGRRRRGETHEGRPGGEHSGISARKGIVGDWRSSFTPKAVARVKELTGNALVTLGYENDVTWGL